MRWYVSLGGHSSGPFEEFQVIQMAGAGQIDHVRGEAGGAWLPLAQSPFAAYMNHSHVPVTRVAQTSGTSLTGLQWVFLLGTPTALIFGMAIGWLGLFAGLSLIAWTVYAHRKGRRSLMSIVWKKPRSLLSAAGTVVIGLMFASLGSMSILAQRKGAADRAAAEERTRLQAEEKERQRRALVAALPQKIQSWRDRLDQAKRLADAKPQDGHQQTDLVKAEVDAHREMLGAPTPDQLATLEKSIDEQREHISAHLKLLENVEAIDRNLAELPGLVRSRSWVAADDKSALILSTIADVENAGNDLKAFIPNEFDTEKKRKEVERVRASIAGPVAQERKRQEREEQKRREKEADEAAYAAVCGPRPAKSSWDGSVAGLERALKETAHDPDSIEILGCTDPVMTKKVCWQFSCNIRGKNMLGAKIFQTRTFTYSTALGFQEPE